MKKIISDCFNAEKKYIVVDEPIAGMTGDSWDDVYSTAEAANQAARIQWGRLTKREQEKRHVYAAVVTRDDLADWAIDEDSEEIDWTAWESCNPCGFDSANL